MAISKAFPLSELAAIVGPGQLLTDPDDMAPYLSDWRRKLHGAAAAVVRPGSTAEVARVVHLAREHKIALVPQGGNTGLCGGATPDASGEQLVLALGRLDRIREVDPLNNTLTAEAGCVLARVQEVAAEAGRLFPLSLGAQGSSQIGGLVSTNAGGTQVLRYGNTRDLVLGLEVVLPDGTIFNGLQGLRKNNTGYDVKQLFIGAEGTLGIVTAAILKLYPRPAAIGTAFVAVPDLTAATRLLRALQDDWGDAVTSFELASDLALSLVMKHFPSLRLPFESRAPFYCLIELAAGGKGKGEGFIADFEASLADAFEAGLVLDATVAQNAAQAREFWRLREEITESERREGPGVKHDVAVAISRVPEFAAQATRKIEDTFPGARVLVFGHLGDGSLHVNVVLPPDAVGPGKPPLDAALFQVVHDLVADFGGSFSAEHGIGRLKRDELERYKDPAALRVMAAVKRALDPDGLFNPGKVIRG